MIFLGLILNSIVECVQKDLVAISPSKTHVEADYPALLKPHQLAQPRSIRAVLGGFRYCGIIQELSDVPLGRKDACLAIPAYGPGLRTEMAGDDDGSAPSLTELANITNISKILRE